MSNHDALFMGLAHAYSEQSTCLRGNVGCVIVRDRHIISGGYNGSPPGQPHCTEVGCTPGARVLWEEEYFDGDPVDVESLEEIGCQRTLHAEANAIAFAALHGVSTAGGTMYSTHTPCRTCGGLMVSAGIKRLVFAKRYRLEFNLELLQQLGIEVIEWSSERASGDTHS